MRGHSTLVSVLGPPMCGRPPVRVWGRSLDSVIHVHLHLSLYLHLYLHLHLYLYLYLNI